MEDPEWNLMVLTALLLLQSPKLFIHCLESELNYSSRSEYSAANIEDKGAIDSMEASISLDVAHIHIQN